jgi:putative transposase
MLVQFAYRFRIYPTRAQVALLAKTFGCKRFIWNAMLAERESYYLEHGTSIGKERKTEKEWKVVYPFLKEVDSIALQQARIDLDTAYDRYFNKIARKPRFKSRKGKQSYRTQYTGGNITVDFAARRLKLPKLGLVDYRDDRLFTERPRNVTVSKTKSGKYFAAILVEREIDIAKKTIIDARDVAGFDMSAKDFITGEQTRHENPRFYRNSQTKLALLHRRVSRKVKGSANRNKARLRLARLYDRIGNRRTDWLQKLSTELANRHDAIAVEDLNVDGMKRWNGGFAKTITLDFSWGAFVNMLGYKMEWRGKYLVKVGRYFASSKLCSNCGFKNDALTLDDRHWTCPSCGARHDRDINAATNITREGIRLLRAENITVITTDSTAGTAGSNARGDRVRPAITAALIAEPGIHGL